MFNSMLQVQIFILALIGFTCIVMVCLTHLIEYQSRIRKIQLITIELATAILLISDMFLNIYMNDTTQIGFWVARISNFLAFFLVYVEIIAFNKYIHTFVKTYHEKKSKTEKIISFASYLGIAMLILSQFNGMYYKLGPHNEYVRGPLFILSYAAPLFTLVAMVVDVIRNKKVYSKHIFIAALIFSLLPLGCSVVQAIYTGSSIFNLSLGLSTVTLFALSFVDQNEFLRMTARTDRMTNLPNAYGLLLEFDKKIEAKEVTNYCAFYFDIVRMGMFNRKYGNEAGDKIIFNYSRVIRNYLLDDEFVGRLGGNYFVAAVRKERVEDFLKLISGTEVELATPMGVETINVTAVAGLYEIEGDYINSNQIMTNVSMAVNIAKNIQKKPYVYLTKELMREMNEQRGLQEIIPKCMANKEFVPFYQPKVNLNGNVLCGAEALARWIHEGDVVPPYKFIPTMERNETICKLDFYMLHAVCQDIKEWLDKGINPPTISVNFSRKNLGNPILAEEIFNVVKSYDIPLELVQIEITETIDEYPLDYLKGVVEALQRYGLTAAIDDFGTGSSSIKILKEVPFDVLKIDKSFIDSISEKDKHILAHIVGMANEMNAKIITEGVETKEQIDVLRELGCEEIQGFYFDRPMGKVAFESRIKKPVYKE